MESLPEKSSFTYGTLSFGEMHIASPAPAYESSKSAAKETIQNFSLDEFATMLFSVTANLKTEKNLPPNKKLPSSKFTQNLPKQKWKLLIEIRELMPLNYSMN